MAVRIGRRRRKDTQAVPAVGGQAARQVHGRKALPGKGDGNAITHARAGVGQRNQDAVLVLRHVSGAAVDYSRVNGSQAYNGGDPALVGRNRYDAALLVLLAVGTDDLD